MIKSILAGALVLSALCINAEEVTWPKPPNGFSSANNNIPHGELSNVINYPTRNYGNRPCRIYTPPGYDENREQKYPVLYLHHGIGGNESAWTSSQPGFQEGNADRVMDFLYAQEDLNVTPMIVVMPMGNMENTSGDTWQNFEDVLKNDLVPYVEENYNASGNPNHRAIAGLSMGAGQTLNFGYKNPDFFTWIGAFSPAPNTISAGQTIQDIDAVKENIHFNFLAAGTNEENPFLSTARAYHNYLDQNGVENLILQVEPGLGHELQNWNIQLHNFAQRIFTNMEVEDTTTFVQLPSERNEISVDIPGLRVTKSGIQVILPGQQQGQFYSITGRRNSIPLNGIQRSAIKQTK